MYSAELHYDAMRRDTRLVIAFLLMLSHIVFEDADYT